MVLYMVGCTVQLVYNEVLNLFSYFGYLGLPFQICEAGKIRREKYIWNDMIIAIEFFG